MSKFFIERPILANVIAIVDSAGRGLPAIICRSPSTRTSSRRRSRSPPTIPARVPQWWRPRSEFRSSKESTASRLDLHAVQQRQRRQLYADRHFCRRHRPNAAIALVQNAVNGALSQLPKAVQVQGVSVQKVSTNVLLIAEPVLREQPLR